MSEEPAKTPSNPPKAMSQPPLSPADERVQRLTLLNIVAVLLFSCATYALLWNVINGYVAAELVLGRHEIFREELSGKQVFGLMFNGVNALCSPLVIFGAVQMLRRRMYGLTRVAAVVAMLPISTHFCCVLGLPLGIGALVLLNQADVKSAFSAE